MSNRVAEQFFTFGTGFGERAPALLREAADRTGFLVDGEIWRGQIYTPSKVGTVIARGSWQGRRAVLKLQGIRPEIEEAEHIRRFMAGNKSARIRAPQVFYTEPWDEARGYGLTVMEEVTAPPLYSPPWASPAERAAWGDLTTELYWRGVGAPWLSPDERETSTNRFLKSRLQSWIEICASAPRERRLADHDQQFLVPTYVDLIDRYGPELPMMFCHGHLGPDDIRVTSPGHYVLLSNFFWSWRPLWYHCAFNVWACLMALLKEARPTFPQAERIVAEWLASYRELSAARADHHFEPHFKFMLLERCVGSCLVDLVVAERASEAEEKREVGLGIMMALARRLIGELS
ncbi:hypothetical protein HY478_04030 [Candidatus Uhrbacteria bacterium]|nr:hypothetical protein [Candidatus Uhrbacteria bacterium]